MSFREVSRSIDDPEIEEFIDFARDPNINTPNPFSIEKKLEIDPVWYAFTFGTLEAPVKLLKIYIKDKESGGPGYTWKNGFFNRVIYDIMVKSERGVPREFINLLLIAGADPNHQDEMPGTLLKMSAFAGFLKFLKEPQWKEYIDADEADNEYYIDLFLEYGATFAERTAYRYLLENVSVNALDSYLDTIEPKDIINLHPFTGVRRKNKDEMELALKSVLRHGAGAGEKARKHASAIDFAYNTLSDPRGQKMLEIILSYGVYPVSLNYDMSRKLRSDQITKMAISEYVKTLQLPLFAYTISTILENNGDITLLPRDITTPSKIVEIDMNKIYDIVEDIMDMNRPRRRRGEYY